MGTRVPSFDTNQRCVCTNSSAGKVLEIVHNFLEAPVTRSCCMSMGACTYDSDSISSSESATPAVPAAPKAKAPVTPPAPKPAPVKSLESRLTEMRTAMEKAIADEQFEDAARLRDEIRRLQETV